MSKEKCFKGEHGERATTVKLSKDLEKYGCSVISILCGHTYTLGIDLMQNKAELFLPSFLSTDMAFVVANKYNEFLKDGRVFELGTVYDDFQEFLSVDIVFKKVLKRKYTDYFGMAINFYGDDGFEVWQMVLPDKNGLFPWDDGCAEFLLRDECVLFEVS